MELDRTNVCGIVNLAIVGAICSQPVCVLRHGTNFQIIRRCGCDHNGGPGSESAKHVLNNASWLFSKSTMDSGYSSGPTTCCGRASKYDLMLRLSLRIFSTSNGSMYEAIAAARENVFSFAWSNPIDFNQNATPWRLTST